MDEEVRAAAVELLKDAIRLRDQPAYRPPDHAVLECLARLMLDLLGEPVHDKRRKSR